MVARCFVGLLTKLNMVQLQIQELFRLVVTNAGEIPNLSLLLHCKMTVHHNRQLTPSDNRPWGRQLASLECTPLDIVYLVADHSSLDDLVTLSTVLRFL